MTETHDPPSPSAATAGPWDFNARVGLVLFFIYLALFLGFIALAAYGQSIMASHLSLVAPDGSALAVLGGINIAIAYGLLLIIAAFALAILYMLLCQPEPVAPNEVEMTEFEVSELAQSEEGSA